MRTIPEHQLDWYKSSYSGGSGGNCLEVARWRKSSHSAGDGGDCLEVALGSTAVVPVRDSKDPHGPKILFRAHAWAAFVGSISRPALVDEHF